MAAPIEPPRPPVDPLALRIDRERVRAVLPELIDALIDAVAVVDADRQVVAANRRYMDAFGASRPDMVGSACRDALHCPEMSDPDDSGRCTACLVLETKQPLRRIRAIPDAAGVPRRWEANFSPVIDPGGRVTHVVEVWRDISERSKLEAQISHSERLAALGSLAAGVAHEINNPLASVLASVESIQRWLLRTTGVPPEAAAEAREVLDVCEREIARVRETTDKLLLLAQPVSTKPTWVNINTAVSDTLSLLGHQMRKQGITCTQDLNAGIPDIWAREGGVRGICMNLAMNAVQAMSDGGTLSARTHGTGNEVVLEIADTGPGIPAGILERIWDPFFTTKPIGKGTGLGLSITRSLVERYGGTIRVDTIDGEGTRFAVTLPVRGPGGEGG